MKKFAVILCGCGSMDGSEIHESVMTMLAIDNAGCQYTLFAPDENQYHVINHLTQQPMSETRNMRVEAARIGRGNVLDIRDFKAEDFDAVVFPGGFGAAKSLFTYAFDGANATVREDVRKVVVDMFQAHKPIGALCISPVMVAKVLGEVTVTVGTDAKTIEDVLSFGAKHQETTQGEVVTDKEHLIFTTPCYMLPATIKDIALCADNLIKSMLESM